MSDINKLLAAEEASRQDHIYLISFEVKCDIKGLMEDDWVVDELSVAAGDNAEVALEKLKAHIADVDEYGMPTKGFRLKGLKLLAVADI